MKFVGDNAPMWSFPKGERSQLAPNSTVSALDSKHHQLSVATQRQSQNSSRSATLAIVEDHSTSMKKSKPQPKQTNYFGRSPRSTLAGIAKTPGAGSYNVGVSDISHNIKKTGGYTSGHLETRGWGLPAKHSPGVGDYKLDKHTIAHRVKQSLGVSLLGRQREDTSPKPVSDLRPG